MHWPVALFLISLVVPWVFYFGALRMSSYRIVLLLMVLPCVIMWMAGKAGRMRITDIAVFAYWFWTTLSLVAIHGLGPSIQTSGIVFVETIGPYMLARCYIRDADDFYNAIQLVFRIVVVLLPFAAYEIISGQNISNELFSSMLPTYPDEPWLRHGFKRVQSVFEHPILFGVFTGSILALVYLVLGYGKNFVQRSFMTGIVGATSLLSLSAGPLIALVTQAFLLCWNGLFSARKYRWKLLITLVVSISLVIELVANRSVLTIVAGLFVFDAGSYWHRRLIWTYGTESIINHPLFGTALGEWARPKWMPPSIDNFWLFQAVTYGLPAACLMMLAFFSNFVSVSKKKGLDPKVAAYRTGLLITMTAFFLVSWTVHFWNAVYVVFLFLMGSGVWILEVKPTGKSALEAEYV